MISPLDKAKSDNLVSRFALRWGGAAGDGLQSTGLLFQKFLNKIGYFVLGFAGTQSSIRGGHVWQHVEFSSESISSFDKSLNLLIALDSLTLGVHLKDIKQNWFLIYNSDIDTNQFQKELSQNNIQAFGIPLSTLTKEIDPKNLILANSVTIGAIICLFSLDVTQFDEILEKKFKDHAMLIINNRKAVHAGFNYYNEKKYPRLQLAKPQVGMKERIIISGNHMIALGAVASGLKFLAQYPITPASSILHYLAQNAKKFGVIVRQTEDEIASLAMCIGASFAGVRAMTATSGPGISLMAELLGYASKTETPIVIVNSTRVGPSTGIPTQMEQSDLLSMIHLSHGESPRVIFAPRNIKECFTVTIRAFNIADRFQVPAIILVDFSLSEKTQSIEVFDLEAEINRGKIWEKATTEFPYFKRYEITDDGISPRAFPPTVGAEHIIVGAEHDELSHSLSGNRCGVSSGELREKMVKKRFRKLEKITEEMNPPEVYGPFNADHTILCWGSTQGAVQHVIDRLNNHSKETWNMICFVDIFPLPVNKLKPIFKTIKHSIWFEVNFTGQMEKLIKLYLNWEADTRIHHLDGETPTPTTILNTLVQTLGISLEK